MPPAKPHLDAAVWSARSVAGAPASRRRRWRELLLVAGAALAMALPATAQDADDALGGKVAVLEIDGGIGPATASYVQRGLERAAAEGAEAVVLRIDTPGGLDAATRDINKAILASEVAVIGYVAPQGARAASAGTYILYATHLAAMSPATSVGAATPISLGGGGPAGAPAKPADEGETDEEGSGEDAGKDAGKDDSRRDTSGSAAERKALNDSIAYLRGLAQRRGRDVGFAEEAVRNAATLTANEALERGVIEIVARDIDDLLAQAQGRRVALAGGDRELQTAGAVQVPVLPDWRSRLLGILTEPTVAYMLLLLGVYGLLFEGYSPGAVVPGVVGAIALLLALYALQVLPVSYAGVALIVLGIALMSVELFVPSFGVLGIGGLVALMVGSLLLFDTDVPGYGVPTGLIVGVGVASGLAFMGVLWLALRARKRPVETGIDELVGHDAIALGDFAGNGRVRIRGEVWQARSDVPVATGERVVVRRIDGLTLVVEPGPAREHPP